MSSSFVQSLGFPSDFLLWELDISTKRIMWWKAVTSILCHSVVWFQNYKSWSIFLVPAKFWWLGTILSTCRDRRSCRNGILICLIKASVMFFWSTSRKVSIFIAWYFSGADCFGIVRWLQTDLEYDSCTSCRCFTNSCLRFFRSSRIASLLMEPDMSSKNVFALWLLVEPHFMCDPPSTKWGSPCGATDEVLCKLFSTKLLCCLWIGCLNFKPSNSINLATKLDDGSFDLDFFWRTGFLIWKYATPLYLPYKR